MAIVRAVLMSPSTHRSSKSSSCATGKANLGEIVPPKLFVNFRELRATRERSECILRDGRREWYEHQAQMLDTGAFKEDVKRYANEVLAKCALTLDSAARRGETVVNIPILEPHATQGWKYAEYHSRYEVSHSVWDQSMCVSIHQTKLQGAELALQSIRNAGGNAEIVREPKDGPDCFVESLYIKITI